MSKMETTEIQSSAARKSAGGDALRGHEERGDPCPTKTITTYIDDGFCRACGSKMPCPSHRVFTAQEIKEADEVKAVINKAIASCKPQMTKKKLDLQAELQKEISKLKRNVRPGYDAQEIRASLSTSFDSDISKEGWLSDHAPEYVWDLIDIAAQWGINHGTLHGYRGPSRWKQ